jgi:hypothetical protein
MAKSWKLLRSALQAPGQSARRALDAAWMGRWRRQATD